MSKPKKTEETLTDWALVKRLYAYIKQDKALFLFALILTPIGVAAEVLQPILLKIGIDDHIVGGDLEGLGTVAAVFVGVVVFAWLAAAVSNYYIRYIAQRVLARLRSDIFAHIMSQGAGFFDRRAVGSLMTRTINDVDAVNEALSRGAVQLMTNALTIVGILIAMVLLDFKLTLVAFAFAPLIWLIVSWFRRQLRPISLQIRESLSRLNGFFAERVFGMSVVQLYGAEDVSIDRFDEMAQEYMRAYQRSNWLDAGLYAIMDGLSSLAIAAVVFFAALQFDEPLSRSAITIGILVAFIEYLGRVFVPIRELSGQIATLQRSFAALEKIFGILDTDERLTEGPGVLPEALAGEIRMEGVSFRYAEGRPDVLKDINLEIQPGEVVALVGATGSGKSTIGKLLSRMYDGYRGGIYLDGVELNEVTAESVRRAVTVVHQDVWIMEGTVEDNIRLGDTTIGEAEIAEALRLSRAESFVSKLPQGAQTQLSAGGKNLSSGERQLLSIARAMARRAPIVVLDEATANIDSATEREIDGALEELFKQHTVLVIAHRLQTIRRADRIVVVDQGEIVERGTHEDLMALGGRYKLLVETGFAL